MIESRVALIGAGPIGLEVAVALKQAGIEYVHLEAAQIGATVAWYPPEMLFHSSADRLGLAGVPLQVSDQQKPKREEYLAYLRAIVQQFGLEVRTYERVVAASRDGVRFVLTTRSLTGERQYRVQQVILAVGAMHLPRSCGIPGEDLPHVSHYFGDPHAYFQKRLLIVGGGNSAVESAVRSQRLGARVTLSYRGADFDEKRIKFWLLPEIRGMFRDGRVTFLPQTVPTEIRTDSVTLASTDRQDCLSHTGAATTDGVSHTGRTDGRPDAGVAQTILSVPADFVLLLTGYRQDPMLFDMLGVAFDADTGEAVHDPATMESNVPGVFIAGTATAGKRKSRIPILIETCHDHAGVIADSLRRR